MKSNQYFILLLANCLAKGDWLLNWGMREGPSMVPGQGGMQENLGCKLSKSEV